MRLKSVDDLLHEAEDGVNQLVRIVLTGRVKAPSIGRR